MRTYRIGDTARQKPSMKGRYFHFRPDRRRSWCLTESLQRVFGSGLVRADVGNLMKALQGGTRFFNISSHHNGIWWLTPEDVKKLYDLDRKYLYYEPDPLKRKEAYETLNLIAGFMLLQGLQRRGYLVH